MRRSGWRRWRCGGVPTDREQKGVSPALYGRCRHVPVPREGSGRGESITASQDLPVEGAHRASARHHRISVLHWGGTLVIDSASFERTVPAALLPVIDHSWHPLVPSGLLVGTAHMLAASDPAPGQAGVTVPACRAGRPEPDGPADTVGRRRRRGRRTFPDRMNALIRRRLMCRGIPRRRGERRYATVRTGRIFGHTGTDAAVGLSGVRTCRPTP